MLFFMLTDLFPCECHLLSILLASRAKENNQSTAYREGLLSQGVSSMPYLFFFREMILATSWRHSLSSRARGEMCTLIADLLNPPEICFWAMSATSNRKYWTCWETALLKFFSPQSLMAVHTQLLLLGVPPDRTGWCKAFFRCLHNEELPSEGQKQLFSERKYCAILC